MSASNIAAALSLIMSVGSHLSSCQFLMQFFMTLTFWSLPDHFDPLTCSSACDTLVSGPICLLLESAAFILGALYVVCRKWSHRRSGWQLLLPAIKQPWLGGSYGGLPTCWYRAVPLPLICLFETARVVSLHLFLLHFPSLTMPLKFTEGRPPMQTIATQCGTVVVNFFLLPDLVISRHLLCSHARLSTVRVPVRLHQWSCFFFEAASRW